MHAARHSPVASMGRKRHEWVGWLDGVGTHVVDPAHFDVDAHINVDDGPH